MLGLQRLAGNQYVARRVSRPFIQREIGQGKSGWIVKHDATDVQYVAYARDANEYDLRPVVGGTTVRVAATNKDYSAVREDKAADLKDITDEGARHTKAGETPFDDLIVFSAKPAVDDLAEHDEALIRGFSDFSELVAHTIDGQDPRSVAPLILSQELYNRGVVLNAHGLYDLFDVQVRFLEHDPAKWLRA